MCSQRASGYKRVANDLYETPEWVTRTLLPHLPTGSVWEPACGSGKMAKVLRGGGHKIHSSDIDEGAMCGHCLDFLQCTRNECDMIITNPPYGQAQAFIEHALELVKPFGLVAMLLRADYDHAKSRHHLFRDSHEFHKKLALTKRIVWFEKPGAAPSFNHAWFIWRWGVDSTPVLVYGPRED